MITDSFKRLASEVFLFIPHTPSHKLHGQKKSPHTLCVPEYTLKDKQWTFTDVWHDLIKQDDLRGVLCTVETDYNLFQKKKKTV